ncbi:hypothetical protein [Pandoraea sp. NPDC090278]|uniref:hypothetical protein n=1 Tax=Pandoraea sp. NPDC090278 TaxID=3364391 RepID=UPI00383A1B45
MEESRLSSKYYGWIASIAISALFSSNATADISGAQAEAMAGAIAGQVTAFAIGAMSACVATYPEMRNDAVRSMEHMVPQLASKPAVADQWIQSVDRCMDKKHTLTRAQCDRLNSGQLDPEGADMKQIFVAASAMLEPCMNAR